MADGHGGYRKPENPAPVSGPGAHSRRTDGKQPVMKGLGNGDYGDESAMQQIQGGAPMSQVASSGPVSQQAAPDPTAGLTPLHAPSEQPGTPVTDGADFGPGRSSAALGLVTNPNQADAQYLTKYLPALIRMADDDNAPPGFKQWVRNVISNL